MIFCIRAMDVRFKFQDLPFDTRKYGVRIFQTETLRDHHVAVADNTIRFHHLKQKNPHGVRVASVRYSIHVVNG